MTELSVASDTGAASSDHELSTYALGLIGGCFVLSGFAALIYQTAWARQFALIFGTSDLAVATVLAAYMGGLGAGAWLIERFLPRLKRPAGTYALFELAIALAATLLVPAGLWLSQRLLLQWFGGQSAPPDGQWGGLTLYYLLSALLILLIPTALMGATLPLLARYVVRRESQIARRIGLLYAGNTAGAVGGALVAALVLLPAVGLMRTVWCAAAVNIVVAAVAACLQWRLPATAAAPASGVSPTPRWCLARSPVWVLPLMLLSGAVSFLHEVLWTRMLSHLLGGSIYAFGVMLASFLSGIALGGALGAWLGRARERAARYLAWFELAAAFAAIAAWVALQAWLPSGTAFAPKVVFGLLLLLPLAIAIGATYPLAVRVLASDAGTSGAASARVYAWNTAGAILGALLGGFVLIPALRYEGTIQLAVAVSCALALAAAVLLAPTRWRAVLPVAIAAVAAMALFWPQPPDRLLQTSPLTGRGNGTSLYYAVGRSAAVTVLDQDDMLLLRTNGLPEASMVRRGSLPNFNGELWMPPLAVLARPDSADMLIVGYGAGRMIEAVPPSVQKIDVIELEPRVIDANRAVRALRASDPLQDSRVNIVDNDARAALSLTTERYDAIVSQPSHPWTAGASHLYTREFMQQAHAHLNANGVFLQWMNIEFLDADLLRSLVATLRDVFPHLRVYRADLDTLVFVASDSPIEPERAPEQLQRTLDRAPRHYLKLGIGAPEDLLSALVLDDEGAQALAGDAAPITDDFNRLATTRTFDAKRSLDPTTLGELLAPYVPLRQPHSFVYHELEGQIDFGYIGRRFDSRADRTASATLLAMADALGDGANAAYLRALSNSAAGAGDERVQQILGEAVQRYPQDDELRFEYIHPQFGSLAFNTASPDVVAAAASLGAVPMQVLAVARAAAQGQWQEVAQADQALSQVPLTAPWSAEATQLRIEWRVRVANENLRQRLCEEALRLIDEAALVHQTPQLRALRAWAGVGLKQPEIVLESVSNFGQMVLAQQRPSGPTGAALEALIPSMRKLLDDVKTDAAIDRDRWQQVDAELTRAQSRLAGTS